MDRPTQQNAARVEEVSAVIRGGAGANVDPHVGAGMSAAAYLDAIKAEPLSAFSFAPAGVSVNQLGPFGTAAKLLQRQDVAA